MRFKYNKNENTFEFSHEGKNIFVIDKETVVDDGKIYHPNNTLLLTVSDYPFIIIKDGILEIIMDNSYYPAIKSVAAKIDSDGHISYICITPTNRKVSNITEAVRWIRRNLDSNYKYNKKDMSKVKDKITIEKRNEEYIFVIEIQKYEC